METLQVIAWDVQHGNATYIKTPGGQHFVIDLGTGSYGASGAFSPLYHLKYEWGVTQLDGVVITHPHRDHLDDIYWFDDLSPKVLWRPNHLSEQEVRASTQAADLDVVDRYLEISRRYSGLIAAGTDPFASYNNGGVEFRVFTPQSCATSNLNNHSIVTIISYLGVKLLVPGDNESPSWSELVADSSFLSAVNGIDVLFASHHGRKAGLSSDLFRCISPRITVISDGPSGETSATALYTQQTQGWAVNRRSGGQEQRRCVTTRNDGVVVVDVGQNTTGTFLQITVN